MKIAGPLVAVALSAVLAGGCESTGTAPETAPPPAGAPAAALDSEPAAAPEAAPATAPDNVSRTATRRPPAPPPPEPAVEIEWRIDESIPTPRDIPEIWLLAKFEAPDGARIVVFERPDGTVIRRRIREVSEGMRFVEEKVIDERPPSP